MALPPFTLLMTRPAAASQLFYDRLPTATRAAFDLCISPLIDIVATQNKVDLGAARGLIFTSANGVTVASDLTKQRDLPCYCVGAATTRTAKAAGWSAVHVADTADQLVKRLAQLAPNGPLLHLSGVHTRGSVAQRLSDLGLITTNLAIYDQRLKPLSPLAQDRVDGPNVVIAPLFSPRTAAQFSLFTSKAHRLTVLALSPAVAQALAETGPSAMVIAQAPNAVAMRAGVEKCLSDLTRVEGTPDAQ